MSEPAATAAVLILLSGIAFGTAWLFRRRK
jgi:hypothetical protein